MIPQPTAFTMHLLIDIDRAQFEAASPDERVQLTQRVAFRDAAAHLQILGIDLSRLVFRLGQTKLFSPSQAKQAWKVDGYAIYADVQIVVNETSLAA